MMSPTSLHRSDMSSFTVQIMVVRVRPRVYAVTCGKKEMDVSGVSRGMVVIKEREAKNREN